MLQNSPLISIIIPTYNCVNTLHSCLSSIIEQNFKDLEICIIDALSTDGTVEIVKKYAQEFSFISYTSEKDNGIYDAMNKGIKLSNGEWLYFLGSDDSLFNNTVLQDIAKKIKHTNSEVIYGNVLMLGKNQWNLDNVVFNGEYNLAKMLVTNICHQCIFYHKDIFEKLGNYDLSYISSSDQEFNLRCYANLTFDYINIIIANFHVGGFSTNVPDDFFNHNRGAILYKYFKNRIFSKEFTKVRLYLKRASFNLNNKLSVVQRLICLCAYIKLKVFSLVENH